MNKLIVLMITLFPISKSFSQTGIKRSKDTIVGLTVPVTRLVIKDLIKGDGLARQNTELNTIVKYKDEQIKLYKDKILLSDNVISNLNGVMQEKDQLLLLETKKTTILKTDLKKQKQRTLLFKLTTFIALVGCGVLFIK